MHRSGLIALAFLWVRPVHSEPPDSCRSSHFRTDDQLQEFLSWRSIDIVRFAERGDLERLRSLVPASANFSMGQHDVIHDLGDGTEGAIRFAQSMQATDFEFMMMDNGPPPPGFLCGDHQVALRFLQPGGEHGFEASFLYKDGQLTQATTHDFVLHRGKIDPK
jgi:hypothetical protein